MRVAGVGLMALGVHVPRSSCPRLSARRERLWPRLGTGGAYTVVNGCFAFVHLQLFQLLNELKKCRATIAKMAAEAKLGKAAEAAHGAPARKKPKLESPPDDETGELLAEVSFTFVIHYREFFLHNRD